MNRLARIGTQLIRNYFPELERVSIIFEMKPDEDSFLYYAWRKHKGIVLVGNKQVAVQREPCLYGGVSHELAHITRDLPLIQTDTLAANCRVYNTCKKVQSADERATDTEVIKRGLGIELLAFADWRLHVQEETWLPNNGLHPTEIRAILTQQKQNGTLKTLPKRYR